MPVSDSTFYKECFINTKSQNHSSLKCALAIKFHLYIFHANGAAGYGNGIWGFFVTSTSNYISFIASGQRGQSCCTAEVMRVSSPIVHHGPRGYCSLFASFIGWFCNRARLGNDWFGIFTMCTMFSSCGPLDWCKTRTFSNQVVVPVCFYYQLTGWI